MSQALALFHPTIAEWFAANLGAPTDIQTKAWPRIASGEHCLITAPTGSGKTLTAFLWALNRFATGELQPGRTRILYISPLKALNNDIRNNLSRPLAELTACFERKGEPFPAIRAQTRSGDTPSGERRQMLRQPPEILITTPESLNLLLSSQSGLSLLQDLDTVIIDEAHSLLGVKRGAYLISAVERLVDLSGEFQRIALSATINPISVAADFIAGYELDVAQPDYARHPLYRKRPITLVESNAAKHYRLSVNYPAAIAHRGADKHLWDALAETLLTRIQANRATLIFTNNRALCEKLTYKINQAADAMVAYAHHGSLSREIRTEVEQRLKGGELAAIVATSSLEMGIDIGALDEVVLVQTAGSVAAAIQRVGRAGHNVGDVSVGSLFPTHPQDFLESAVLAKAIMERDLEPVRPLQCPLDVLAQIIISMTGVATWDLDELYAHLRMSSVYHPLPRRQFDLVIDMLAGRYAESRIRELQARVSVDRLDNTVTARPGALLSLYQSGGVIPDRGYFHLRHQDSSARIGELDEEFVWEAKIGQSFTLGAQFWQIQKITHNDVFVLPAKAGATTPPFWKAESISRNFHFSEQIGLFLKYLDANLDADDLVATLQSQYCMTAEAADPLLDFLRRQRAHTGRPLPHRHHLLVEIVDSILGHSQGRQMVLHTGWGAEVNRPWGMALEAAWLESFGEQPVVYVSNECIVLQMPEEIPVETILSLVSPERIEALLRARLEGSGFFGARFRECAGRALLLNRGKFNERRPLWMSRLQSQKLLNSVLKYEDFPILLETWRTCLQDEFDLLALKQLLEELQTGQVQWSVANTRTPSPMAQNIAWEQVNLYMYKDDTPTSDKSSNLSEDLLRELLYNDELRPTVNAELCQRFVQKRQRLTPGYAPDSARDLLDWIKERGAIPDSEWRALLARIESESGKEALQDMLTATEAKRIRLTHRDAQIMVARENQDSFAQAFYPETDGDAESDALFDTLLGEWLRFYGPVSSSEISHWLGVDPQRLQRALDDLVEARAIVAGPLIEGDTELRYCDRENFEILLHMARKEAAPEFAPLPLEQLPLFLHCWQTQACERDDDPHERLFDIMQRLQGTPAPAPLWESEILPARLPDYNPALLDHLFQESDLEWLGVEEGKTLFCFNADLDLLDAPSALNEASADELQTLFPDADSRYDFQALSGKSGWDNRALTECLWDWVWKQRINNDTFAALRRGVENKFTIPDLPAQSSGRPPSRRRAMRHSFAQSKQAANSPGTWRQVRWPLRQEDPITEQERGKDRARLLLSRYGVVFRELLQRELPEMRWSAVFRSLRLMELSREIIGGYFFKDIPGPQFITPIALQMLQTSLPQTQIYWFNATDPMSLCGLGLPGLQQQLPKRLDSIHMAFKGPELIMTSRRNGKQLDITIAPDHPDIEACLAPLCNLLYRPHQPLKNINLETINGEKATDSPYLVPLSRLFDVQKGYKDVALNRKLL
ncbi:DEAD/DEAH box helicase [Hahella sp. NBU794]|uniref:DEAD/DEAH box helicase n=1 Tax=Hahella sp. NBU794 TaxID=3422590 RepID=UPI003D6ED9A9